MMEFACTQIRQDSMKRILAGFVVTAFAPSAMFGFAVPGIAAVPDDRQEVSAEVVAQSLAGVGSSLRFTPAVSSGLGENPLRGGAVDVPADLTDGVKFTISDGTMLVVELPGAESAEEAAVLADGTVTYPSEGFSNSVIVSDLGTQMLTTIAAASAPTTYEYEMELAPGQNLQIADDGGAEIVDSSGRPVMSVLAPWAQDAAGKEIPTRYLVEGDKLIQVIEHTSVPGATYPVVADPAFVPWVVARCLLGLGLNWATITRIWSMGGAGSVQAAFGYAAARCVMGR